jgi:5,5'-dehydrodivanillate O-demethylase oxygenase subunit
MLDKETNQLLTRVARGTQMGELLRRYWWPVAATTELEERPTKPIRVLGEDLVLYKDHCGNYGLLDRHCPHRGADLAYGYVEDCGLRCNYHGWLFEQSGRCLEQPYQDIALPHSRLKAGIRITAYKVVAQAGLLWAYLGPAPDPLLPNWEQFTWPNGFVQIVFATLPCNWFQCQENSIDPVHFEWTHDNWSMRLRGVRGPYSPRHLKVAFEEFEYGMIYRRIREGQDEGNPLWTVGRVCLWPNAIVASNHFQWRVPIDHGNTLSVHWFYTRVPKGREPYCQARIPYWFAEVTEASTGRLIDSHVTNQDFVAFIGQGEIADRTRENLDQSDEGIVMMRKRFLDDLRVIASGGDPKAVIRDAEKNRCIRLPLIGRDDVVEGIDREELKRRVPGSTATGVGMADFPWLAGQPAAIKDEFEQAMGWR